MGVPCLTLRDETEWVAIIETGWNKLVGADQKSILDNWFNFVPPVDHPAIYGFGTAGQQIAEILNKPGVKELGPKKIHSNNPNPLDEVNS